MAEAILLGYTPQQAADAAGYSDPKVTAAAYQDDPEWAPVRDWVSDRAGTDEWKALVANQEIFEHLLYRIRFDPRSLFNDNGEPIPISQMTRRDAACIEQIEYSSFQQGEQSGEKVKIKLAKRDEAIRVLGKAFGFFDDNSIDVNVHGDYQAAAEQVSGILDRMREKQQAEQARAAAAAEEAEQQTKRPPPPRR